MLRTLKDLQGYVIRATDGDIGHVTDVYFDDQQWVVRYLVVETGSWLASRKVLISPFAIGHSDWPRKVLPVAITKEQVKNCPDVDTDKPVSRRHEVRYLGYYGYPYYWGGVGPWGNGLTPSMMLMNGSYGGLHAEQDRVQSNRDNAGFEAVREEDGDPHLRSCKAVLNYHIEASDGGIGHVDNLLIDEATWAIRYMIVDTSNWWLGHQVAIAPQWIREVDWFDNIVSIDATRQSLKDAPPYDPAIPLGRDQEMDLYRHHGRAGYWAREGELENPGLRLTNPASRADEHRPHGTVGDDRSREG
ncbi:MAG: PRC-barrel domain-containing protein [Steroidobacteraceae bacterium]